MSILNYNRKNLLQIDSDCRKIKRTLKNTWRRGIKKFKMRDWCGRKRSKQLTRKLKTLIRLSNWMLEEILKKCPGSYLQLLMTLCSRKHSLENTIWSKLMVRYSWIEILKYLTWFLTIWDMIHITFLKMSMKKSRGYLTWRFNFGALSKNSILKWSYLKTWLNYWNRNQHLI